MLTYQSIAELIEAAEKEGEKLSRLVLRDQAEQMELSEEELYKRMEESFDVMCEAVRKGQDKNQRSTSGLTGGEGYKMKRYSEKTDGGLSGSFMTRAMSRALAVSGCNASMGRIVATPTAGSCGIMPGCLVSLYEDRGFSKKEIVMSMFTAAAFGEAVLDGERVRTYRTGDEGMLDTAGMLRYRGRIDAQVKMSGYRIELGEIEAILCGEAPYLPAELEDPANDLYVHRAMIAELAGQGLAATRAEAHARVERYVDRVCAGILDNTAVFKRDEAGRRGFDGFMKALGLSEV